MSHGDIEAFREAIIGASLELGQAYGEDGVTMRAIASKLGTSATTLYTCFESKAAIMRELRLRGLQTIANSIREALALPDARESLLEVTRRYIAFARDNPWLYQLLMLGEQTTYEAVTEQQRAQLAGIYEDLRGKFHDKMRELLDRSPTEERRLFARWWSAVHGISSLLITRRLRADHQIITLPDLEGFVDDYARDVIDFMLAGDRQ